KSFLLFVDDGSQDKTWEIIESLSNENEHVKGIKLSRNQGHQIALVAGMEYALNNKCDCLVSIDADLQDDVNAIEQMVAKYRQGYEIIYGVKSDRRKDSFLKRFTAESFYHLMNLFGVNLIFNHADFRLLSAKATEYLLQFTESNVFIRGMIPLIGLNSTFVYYEIKERFAGQSKYSFKKMLNLALDGITSFSVVPLRIISAIGFFTFMVSSLMGLYTLGIRLFTNDALPGWASTILPIYFIGGIQLLSLGVIGEYIGKIYIEAKRRPRYFIEKETKK
ncbi:MAG: glycosyltransferase family 2 protein, partial [Bacteroidales bacterium]